VELDETLIDTVHATQSAVSLISGWPEAGGLYISILQDTAAPALNADAREANQPRLNLLSNSVKFPDKGSITVKIAVAADGWLIIAVSDSGIGIPKAEIGNLMQPFFQVDNSLARKFEGTGLGLALSKSLMQLRGGELLIESVEGEGNTVTCRFPPARVDPALTALENSRPDSV
jgi:signal transduction histidine kinase